MTKIQEPRQYVARISMHIAAAVQHVMSIRRARATENGGAMTKGPVRRIWVALVLVVAASALFWSSRDYAVRAPDWDGQVRGLSYSPSHLYREEDLDTVSTETIDRDLEQLSEITGHIRTYTVDRGLNRVPEIARRHGLSVSLGIWIGPEAESNEKEIALAIDAVLNNRRVVDRVFVGNEAILRGDVTVDELNAYIARVRKELPNRIKVSTAEPWNVWLANPRLGEQVDFIGAHILPYWEGISTEQSLKALETRYAMLQEEFPGKPIVIAEAGWPSEGRTRRAANASVADQAFFVRSFISLAAEHGYDYYVIEAFDQPWKAGPEGAVGAYWGMFSAEGTPKYSFTGILRSFPQWRTYAGVGALLILALGLAVLGRMPRVRVAGYVVVGALVAAVTTGMLMLVNASALEYLQASDAIFYLALVPLVLLACTVILTEGTELALSLWREDRRRIPAAVPDRAPKVSIHVPCYNEPPAMVIETLNALSRLAYDDFEVIVLDNNTADPAVWRPVQDHCATLGTRFRFFHMDGVKGFKAGALNEALALTDPAADFIAVIDSDYQVHPQWLSTAMPLFVQPKIAVVQAPQDYRDRHESLFKAMCYQEYRGFFQIGMVERNEQDAIIQHGTMTIVRKNALEEVGGWSAWCITEDTELGLKLFEKGYSAAYIPQSLGRGVMPDTLAAFMVQRHRWVYGAMQIFKRHASAILLGRSKLTHAQRYQFLAGWLPWISDGLAVIVTGFALVWTTLMTVWPRFFDVPMAALSGTALALFAVKLIKTFLLYPYKVGSGVRGALYASIAGLSLTHTVGKAVLTGLLTSGKPFMRTPKCENPAALSSVLRLAWQEILLFTLCAAAFTATGLGRGLVDPAAGLWMVMLAVQALPFAATIIVAALSAAANMKGALVPQARLPAVSRKAAA